ncbi:MAG TPA: hypothetical protein VLE99_06750 [Candidatus Saccharimonadales bacterium]|nr:hypothetical protein [Candidatus Saccharimonadales bacterium]
MGEHEDSGVGSAASSKVVVGDGKKHRGLRLPSWRVLGLCVAALVIAGGGVVLYVRYKHHHDVALAQQHQAEQAISDVDRLGDPGALKADSTNLIQGAKDGSYKVSNKQLAAAYAARGDAELAAGDNKAAVSDYEQAVKLDATQKALVGYSEFVARYRTGERKTLIPMLQDMAAPLKNSHEIGAYETYVQYEGYITDLQAGKDLDL